MTDILQQITAQIIKRKKPLDQKDVQKIRAEEQLNCFKRKYKELVNNVHVLLTKYFKDDVDIGYAYAIVNRLMLYSYVVFKSLSSKKSIYFLELGEDKLLFVSSSEQFLSNNLTIPFYKEKSLF